MASDVLRLLPVVELEPGSFGTRELPAADDSDAARDAWFLACLGEAGIDELRPFRPRSWLVPVEQVVRSTTIARILKARLATFDRTLGEAAADPDAWMPLDGGFVLIQGEQALVEPGCCSDLANLNGWRRAASGSDESWAMLWIGHPWRSTRRVGDLVEISPAHEDDLPSLTVDFRVEAAQLDAAVDRARAELVAFGERVRTALEREVADRGVLDDLVRTLVGLKDELI